MSANESILEIRRRPFGLGYSLHNWPLTRHHVVRIGWVESRLIVPRGIRLGVLGSIAALVGGIFMGGGRPT